MERHPRYLLLHTWIRFFSWAFLIVGAFAALVSLSGVIFDFEGRLMLFGIRYAGPLRDWLPAGMGIVFAFQGYAAFALLWGKSEGRELGLAAGYIGLALCATGIFFAFQDGRLYVTFEPFLQVPFIVKLHGLKARWEEEPPESPLPIQA